jgi:glycosyltransferase involved in cell wall biosynthesis
MEIPAARVSSVLPGGEKQATVHRRLSLLAGVSLRALPAYDGSVIASSYAFAHWRRAMGSKIVYCHSPLRQIYSSVHEGGLRRVPPAARRRLLNRVWMVDRTAAQEADVLIGTSSVVGKRIARYWGREPDVLIPPPVDLEAFRPVGSPSRDYLLFVGRVVEPYKRLSLLIEAVRDTAHQLVVVGDGRDKTRLMASSPPNVKFLGPVHGDELRLLYANARLTVFPSTDDFGMVPIESLACGTPVVAFGEGGALDSVDPGMNGVLFDALTPHSLNRALQEALRLEWSDRLIRQSVVRFSREAFVSSFSRLVRAV